MEYREYEIQEPLKPFVKVIWSMRSSEKILDPQKTRILPDLSVELVFHFADPFFTTLPDQSCTVQPGSFVVGTMKEWMEIQPGGRAGLIAARFSAWGARQFFPFPQLEITNRIIDLQSLLGRQGRCIEEQIQGEPTMTGKAATLQRWLVQRMQENEVSDDFVVDSCISTIQNSQGLLSIRGLAKEAAMSPRQLRRRFQDHVGLSPKEFARIVRFHTAVKSLQRDPAISLTDVSCLCGYYDQSHFIHDFEEYCGLAPGEYVQKRENIV